MTELISFPLCKEALGEYENSQELTDSCRRLGCHGIEAIWGGEEDLEELSPLPGDMVMGYHITFYPDWLDFWQGNERALLHKFGSKEAYRSFYGGVDRESLIEKYRADIQRAVALQAKYVVFHVSNVSISEGYTYQWAYSDRAVLDGAIELINLLFEGKDYPFALLVENQWWPGFTFTKPCETAYLLAGIRYPDKGIMLDIGHLMNTNTDLETETEAIAYIHEILDRHGSLNRYIRGVHLHQSLSGSYVKANTGQHPPHVATDYVTRFNESYRHILKIDHHHPWTDSTIAHIIDRIKPEFLTHELSCKNRSERENAVALQRKTLMKGGIAD